MNGELKVDKLYTKVYTTDQLESALIDVDDMLARAAVPYFIIGETAKQMVNREKLSGDGIYIGIRRNQLTPEVLSTINTHQPELKLTGKEEGFSYLWQDTPVFVHYIEQENEYFVRPDHVWHNAWEYSIPNPFKEYLKTI